jgi:hypothetical protein
MAKSWREKHDNHPHPAHIETLDKPYAGFPRGATMLIATPKEMTAYFRSVPRGKTRTMEQLRAALAKRHGADVTCPLTTGIFCRIAAEHAWERHEMGARSVAPFWRVIDPDSPLARKLTCGPEFIRKQRAAEGTASPPPLRKQPTSRKRLR